MENKFLRLKFEDCGEDNIKQKGYRYLIHGFFLSDSEPYEKQEEVELKCKGVICSTLAKEIGGKILLIWASNELKSMEDSSYEFKFSSQEFKISKSLETDMAKTWYDEPDPDHYIFFRKETICDLEKLKSYFSKVTTSEITALRNEYGGRYSDWLPKGFYTCFDAYRALSECGIGAYLFPDMDGVEIYVAGGDELSKPLSQAVDFCNKNLRP